MQLSLAKNQVNLISLAAMFVGQKQADTIDFKVILKEQQNARSSFNFEISGIGDIEDLN